jgi:hypothetical protein
MGDERSHRWEPSRQSAHVAQRDRTDQGGSREGRGRHARSVAAIGLLSAVELLALGSARQAWEVVRRPGPASLDEAVLVVVLAACALIGGWLVLTTLVAVAAHVPGRLGTRAGSWSRRWSPALARRVAAVLVGAAVGGTLPAGLAAGAVGAGAGAAAERGPGFTVTASSAEPSGAHQESSPPDGSSLAPGWAPGPMPTRAARPATATAGSTPVVVQRGDSLWSIARQHLGPAATDAEVALAWPRWYATNRDVVGPDPNLLRPGQLLRAPGSGPTAGSSAGPTAGSSAGPTVGADR